MCSREEGSNFIRLSFPDRGERGNFAETTNKSLTNREMILLKTFLMETDNRVNCSNTHAQAQKSLVETKVRT